MELDPEGGEEGVGFLGLHIAHIAMISHMRAPRPDGLRDCTKLIQ